MGLLMLSTLLDYTYGFWVASENRKKARFFLWLSVLNNLGILAVFKYYNFFAEQFQYGLAKLGIEIQPYILSVALPVGISFYTFHGMSYVFDIYNKKQKPIKSFLDYGVFVSFFPLLVAGPIERASHLLPQVQKKRIFEYSEAVIGLRLMLWGMFKKVVIADNAAHFANPIFENFASHSNLTICLGIFLFTIQIYGDFSGYSDIALGTARLFGFRLLDNFRFPYFATSVSDFWKRWHISLSSWFRDYLYFPLGGSKSGIFLTIRNTFIIFLVSGFWHGASWNFILWGFLHALGFLPNLLAKHTNTKLIKLPKIFSWLLTMILVMFGWLLFRITDLHDLSQIIHSLITESSYFVSTLSLDNSDKLTMLHLAAACFLLFIMEFLSNDSVISVGFIEKIRSKVLRYTFYIMILFLVVYLKGSQADFIYFAF
jgi:D-alanyl-lipoteichoic acid acyltransferase DltB (MBOAT superfamily)